MTKYCTKYWSYRKNSLATANIIEPIKAESGANETNILCGGNPITCVCVQKWTNERMNACLHAAEQINTLKNGFNAPRINFNMSIWLFYDDKFRNEKRINFCNVPFSCSRSGWALSISRILSPSDRIASTGKIQHEFFIPFAHCIHFHFNYFIFILIINCFSHKIILFFMMRISLYLSLFVYLISVTLFSVHNGFKGYWSKTMLYT